MIVQLRPVSSRPAARRAMVHGPWTMVMVCLHGAWVCSLAGALALTFVTRLRPTRVCV